MRIPLEALHRLAESMDRKDVVIESLAHRIQQLEMLLIGAFDDRGHFGGNNWTRVEAEIEQWPENKKSDLRELKGH